MTAPSFGPFSERKAAQTAAFFLYQAGGRLEILKLMKLLYLAERESLRRHGEPVFGDWLACLPHGPVPSQSLNLANGMLESKEGGWDTWVADRAEHVLALRDKSLIRSPEEDLLALSEDDLEVLYAVWKQFGHYPAFKLRDYTHSSECPEWDDPKGSSTWIEPRELLRHLDYSPEASEAIAQRLTEQAELDRLLRPATAD